MSDSRIRPSPARSQGQGVPASPRRVSLRKTRSVSSPARSTASARLSSVIRLQDLDSFRLSPVPTRRSVLNDDTDVAEETKRRSWWKKLSNNSSVMMEVLNDNKVLEANEAIEEYIDIEVLSQEKKNYTMDIPESSDSESISSIVIPQRKLFTEKENKPQKKFSQLLGTRRSSAKLHKTTDSDNTVTVAPKNLFNHPSRAKSKPVFPAELLTISPAKVVNKTKEITAGEVKVQVRPLFGNRASIKRKNMFIDFIVSESEDEISEIQPRVFGFQKKGEQQPESSNAQRRDPSPTSSITTDIEMDEWKHLPSSTMVENQLEDMMADKTPVKKAKLSKLSTNNTSINKTKQSVKDKSLNSSKVLTRNQSQNHKEQQKQTKRYGQNSLTEDASINVNADNQKQVVEETQDKFDKYVEMDKYENAITENYLDTDTPVKKAKLSKLSTNNTSINKTKQSIKDKSLNSSKVLTRNQSQNHEEQQKQAKRFGQNSLTEDASINVNAENQQQVVEEILDDFDKVVEMHNDENAITENYLDKDTEKNITITDNQYLTMRNKNSSISSTKPNNKSINSKNQTENYDSVKANASLNKSKPSLNIEPTTSQTKNDTIANINVTKNVDKSNQSLTMQNKNSSISSIKPNNKSINSKNQTENYDPDKANASLNKSKPTLNIEPNTSQTKNDTIANINITKNVDKSKSVNSITLKDNNESLNTRQKSIIHNEIADKQNFKDASLVNQKLSNAVNESKTKDQNQEESEFEEENEIELSLHYESEEDDQNQDYATLAKSVLNDEETSVEKENDSQDETHNDNENKTQEEIQDESYIKNSETQNEKEEQINAVVEESENENNDQDSKEPNEYQEKIEKDEHELSEQSIKNIRNASEVEEPELELEHSQEEHEKSQVQEQSEVQEQSVEEQEQTKEEQEQSVEAQEQSEEEHEQTEEEQEQNEEAQELSAEEQEQSEEEQEQSVEAQEQSEEEQEQTEEEQEQSVEAQEQSEEEQEQTEEEQEQSVEAQDQSEEEQEQTEEELEHSDEEQVQSEEEHELEESQEVEPFESSAEIEDSNENNAQNDEDVDMENDEENELENSETPNVSHDTTGRHRKKEHSKVKSPEAVLHDKTKQIESFMAKGRNTSLRRTSIMKSMNIRTSLAPPRESTGLSDGTRNSSAEGSGWDSHRTTRKTLRQTFGKDFSPRKSLRALVMEKSAKRQTAINDITSVTSKFPQANSTELPETSKLDENDYPAEANHDVSKRTRQTTLEMYLQKIKKQNMEKKMKMEEAVRNSLKAPPKDITNIFKVPARPPFAARKSSTKQAQSKPKARQIKSNLLCFDDLPDEVREDMKYKPPKRYQPNDAAWITKRLYKSLETKLEPKYDYKARVRAEKLVQSIYQFCRELKRREVAPPDAVDLLKHEMARLDIVKTHFEFYQFFREYMPREIRIKVIPDIVNKIPMPRHGIFSDILRGNTIHE